MAAAGGLCAVTAVGAVERVLVVNKGIGGNATSDGLRRFKKDVLDVKPDHLILYYGMNDSHNPRRRVAPEVFRKNYQSMIDQAKQAGIKHIILVTINPVNQAILQRRVGNHPGKKDLNGYLTQFDNIVRKLAKKNNLPLVDLRELCMKYGGGNNVKKSLIRVDANGGRNDGVHLTATGYQKFAELFIPFFKGKIKPGDIVVCLGDSITYGAHMPGAGTINGQTYPAWLSVYLNQLVGASKRKSPPPPFKLKGIPQNGDMEYCPDRIRPGYWQVWNVKNRQEGDYRIAVNQGVTGNAMKVINTNPKFPANVLSLDMPKIRPTKQYTFSFQYKGTGKIRPVILFYAARNKFLGAYPKTEKDNPWRQASAEWKTDTQKLQVPAGTIKTRASFRVSGTVLLDNVKFSAAKLEKKINRPVAVATLKNKYISLQVRDPKDGGGIISIRNAKGVEFINGLKDPVLWEVILRHLPTKKYKLEDYVKLSLDPEVSDGGAATNKDDLGDSSTILNLLSSKVKAQCKVEKSADRVKLSWNNIDVNNEKGVLDVFVEFKLAPNDRFVRIRSGVRNRSKQFTVFYLFAPRVTGIYPQDNDLSADRLVVPSFTGRLVYNPIENGILGKSRRFQPNRSGHSMQFDAYYHKNQGLYLGCFDGAQNIKRYLYETGSNGLLWAMGNVPDNMKVVPQNYTTPYDTVIRCFQGDWYDAARIYREWALKQTWCAEGPVKTRKSTPQWYKDIDEWMLWNTHKKDQNSIFDPLFMKPFKKYGLKIGIDYHKWGKGQFLSGAKKTPDRFPMPQNQLDFIKHSHKVGAHVFGYLQGVCWCMESASFKRENGFKYAVRSFYGQPIVWDLREHKTIIAYPGSMWEKVLGDTIVKMAQAGFDGAYLDSNNHAGTYMNFNPLYNKQSGGGNEYIKANQRMMRNIKAKARKYHPGFCFTAESFWEGNMAELDAIKAVNTWHRYLKKGASEQIPLAAAVYHDHCILFGCWVGRHSLQEDGGLDYIVKHGMALVQGFKPGWNQPAHMNQFKNKELAFKTSMLRYRAYNTGKKFLLYGTMMRPPVMLSPKKRIDLRWWRAWSKSTYKVDVPVVMSSLWKAPDGSYGLVLYNVTAKAVPVKVQLSSEELRNLRNVKVKSLWPENLKVSTSSQAGAPVVNCTVPAQSPMIVQIKK